jgi:hypothetical protein
VPTIAQPSFVPFDDPSVSSGPIGESWSDLPEQNRDRLFVRKFGQRSSSGVQGALLCQRDQFFNENTGFFGFFDRGDNSTVSDHSNREISHQGQTMTRVSTKGPAKSLMTHDKSISKQS